MTQFTIFTTDSAPEDSADRLQDLQDAVGFIPNIHAMFAASPIALEALMALNTAFARSGFSAAEREVISLATSVFNQCSYCVAGHSAFGRNAGLPSDAIAALRDNQAPENRRLEALRRLTRALLSSRGAIEESDMAHFLDAGFSREQFFELLVGVAAKVMTNFGSKTAQTPLDQAFAADAWRPAGETSTTLENA